MAQIKVNGEIQTVELPVNVKQLIELNRVQQPDMVSVQLNGEFAERDEWVQTRPKEGERVDYR